MPDNQESNTQSSNAILRAKLQKSREVEVELRGERNSAEEASRVKSEFMANISHELRTPMNAILGMTELALQESLTPRVREYLKTVQDSADTMLFLINDILDFSRLEAGRFELDPVSLNLRSLLDETMRTLALRAHEKGLELAYHVDHRIPDSIVADPMRLRQILTNLVNNAIKFTEQGEVVLRVLKDASKPDKSNTATRAKFCVTDTGIGISKQDIERIFVPFAQADSSTTRHYSGTGLGLSICSELIELMGGSLEVRSEPTRGSDFYFTIDLILDDDQDPSPADVGNGRQVLVVDDNQSQREIVGELLAELGFQPTLAANADDAFSILSQDDGDDIAFLVVDALMPGTDGFMLTERVQSDHNRKTPVALMVSPADRQVFSDRCESLKLSHFLDKPVSRNAVHEVAFSVLNEETQPQRSGSRETITAPPRTLRILVAEDTPANQKVLRAMLTRRGHSLQIAHNGREALDRLHQDGDFDLVLMDVQMPTMDGIQATQAIRESEHGTNSRIPIIAMTAHAMRGDREACLAAGMDHYIAKPINYNRLIRAVERFGLPPGTASQVAPLVAKQSQTSSSSKVWNADAALRRLGKDESLLADLIDFFHEDSVTLQATIEAAIQSADAYEIQRNAHALKGLCANFEAPIATEAANDIERRAAKGMTQAGEFDLKSLKQAVKELADALAQWKSDRVCPE
jgi:signal transduction histidine kinase/CheY-like chemotaxis protein